MLKRAIACTIAAAMVWTTAGVPVVAQGNTLNVKLDGLPPGSALSIAINIGKIPNATAMGTATAKGEALMALDLGNLGKQVDVQVDVYVGKCPDDSVRAFIVASGQVPPDQCGRKKIGAFFINRQHNITIHFPDKLTVSQGLLTPRNALIGGGALGGLLIVVLASGDGSNGGTNNGGGGGGNNTALTDFNGNYTGTATKGIDNCGTFAANSVINGTLNVNSSGSGSWVKTHTSAGITFTFSITLAKEATDTYVFNGTTTQTVGGALYSVQDQGSVKGKAMTIVQTFTRQTTPCTAVYNVALTRP